jgi:hypothetical protein
MDSPAADHSDVIVGSWHLPGPLERVPPIVWAFAFAGLVDAALRAVTVGGVRPFVTPPLELVFVVLSFLPQAAFLFLPGAVLLGRWTGRRASLVIRGAVLLALAEVLFVAVFVLGYGIGGESDSPFMLMDRLRGLGSVRLLGAIFALTGALLVADGVRPERLFVRRPGIRAALAAIAIVTIVGAIARLASLAYPLVQGAQSSGDPFLSGFITVEGLLSEVFGIVTAVTWGVIAWFATVRLGSGAAPRRRWALISVGATSISLASAIASLPMALAYAGMPALLMSQGTALSQLYSTINVVGVVCILAGFAAREAAGVETTSPGKVPQAAES